MPDPKATIATLTDCNNRRVDDEWREALNDSVGTHSVRSEVASERDMVSSQADDIAKSKRKPEFFDQLVRINFAYIGAYYKLAQKQADTGFWLPVAAIRRASGASHGVA